MSIEIRKEGKVVARSKNLRGIYDYNREKSHITFYRVIGKDLYVRFKDGAEVYTHFADATVLSEWVAKTRMFEIARSYFTPEEP